jgi:hypothetical protein
MIRAWQDLACVQVSRNKGDYQNLEIEPGL